MNLRWQLLSIAESCSREGAGIGEGLAWFFKWASITIAVVLTIAIVSGVIVGRRKGALGRQVLIHVLCGAAILVAAPFIWYLVTDFQRARALVHWKEQTAIIEAWLAPLKNPRAGELDVALAAVLDSGELSKPDRVLQLISDFPALLAAIDAPLNERERNAVQAAAQRLRSQRERLERERSEIRPDPDTLDRLDGGVAWLLERPDLPAALKACTGRANCNRIVLEQADKWCMRKPEACRAGLSAERLAMAAPFVKGDQDATWRLDNVRARSRPLP